LEEGVLPKVAILLSTYRGQRYLAEQLESFARQTHANWEVWASDDGSQDGTRDVLAQFQTAWPAGALTVLDGPGQGFAANFLSLTCNASIQSDYFAYSDQDDIWHADKLERALQWLSGVPSGIPALYCSRTQLVDSANHEIGFSPLCSNPCFANALIQNIASGNTMVFNNAARALLQQAGRHLPVVYHDWWAYIAVTGCGGQVFFDPAPTLRYRQHDSNQVGMETGWTPRLRHWRQLFQGQSRERNNGNIAALRKLEDRLTPENREVLSYFVKAREMGLLPRLINLCRSGVYRQSRLGNISLFAEAIFNKI
jgi:glycosyltransferase involved in cell wall biosynthesis